MEKDLVAIAFHFIDTLQNRKTTAAITDFYHPDIQQIEFPNKVTPCTTVRNLGELKEAAEKGKRLLQEEVYEIIRSYTFDNSVIIEAKWTGTLAIPFGNLPAGGQIKAHFAQFYEFSEGKIIRQRNYDCFDPA